MINWKKRILNKWGNGETMRYEYIGNGYTIDISMNKNSEQRYAGSNQVNIFMPKYGGWILGTPKSFKTKKEVYTFVSNSKKKLEKGEHGKKVPFPN